MGQQQQDQRCHGSCGVPIIFRFSDGKPGVDDFLFSQWKIHYLESVGNIYIQIYIYICISIYIHIYIYIYVCIYICKYVYIYVYIYMFYIYIYICVFFSVYIYVCVYICIYTYMYIYICIYIYTYICILGSFSKSKHKVRHRVGVWLARIRSLKSEFGLGLTKKQLSLEEIIMVQPIL